MRSSIVRSVTRSRLVFTIFRLWRPTAPSDRQTRQDPVRKGAGSEGQGSAPDREALFVKEQELKWVNVCLPTSEGVRNDDGASHGSELIKIEV